MRDVGEGGMKCYVSMVEVKKGQLRDLLAQGAKIDTSPTAICKLKHRHLAWAGAQELAVSSEELMKCINIGLSVRSGTGASSSRCSEIDASLAVRYKIMIEKGGKVKRAKLSSSKHPPTLKHHSSIICLHAATDDSSLSWLTSLLSSSFQIGSFNADMPQDFKIWKATAVEKNALRSKFELVHDLHQSIISCCQERKDDLPKAALKVFFLKKKIDQIQLPWDEQLRLAVTTSFKIYAILKIRYHTKIHR